MQSMWMSALANSPVAQMVSEPWFGSVPGQQPMYFPSRSSANGTTISRIRSGLPLLAANMNGMPATLSAIARPALPQPNSSPMRCDSSGPNDTPPNCGGRRAFGTRLAPSRDFP
jgi:hypothetical protein